MARSGKASAPSITCGIHNGFSLGEHLKSGTIAPRLDSPELLRRRRDRAKQHASALSSLETTKKLRRVGPFVARDDGEK
jgi:hypothetical protein